MSKKNGNKKRKPGNHANLVSGIQKTGALLSRLYMKPLSESDQQRLVISIYGSLDALHKGWDAMAFRALSHIYRVADYLGKTLGVPRLAEFAEQSRQVLIVLMRAKEDAPRITEEQYLVLRTMCRYLVLLITDRRVSYDDWIRADAHSYAVFQSGIFDQFVMTPMWVKRAGWAILNGETVKSWSEKLGKAEREISSEVIDLGMVLHAFLGDCTVPLPNNIRALRKSAELLDPEMRKAMKLMQEYKLEHGKPVPQDAMPKAA